MHSLKVVVCMCNQNSYEQFNLITFIAKVLMEYPECKDKINNVQHLFVVATY